MRIHVLIAFTGGMVCWYLRQMLIEHGRLYFTLGQIIFTNYVTSYIVISTSWYVNQIRIMRNCQAHDLEMSNVSSKLPQMLVFKAIRPSYTQARE